MNSAAFVVSDVSAMIYGSLAYFTLPAATPARRASEENAGSIANAVSVSGSFGSARVRSRGDVRSPRLRVGLVSVNIPG